MLSSPHLKLKKACKPYIYTHIRPDSHTNHAHSTKSITPPRFHNSPNPHPLRIPTYRYIYTYTVISLNPFVYTKKLAHTPIYSKSSNRASPRSRNLPASSLVTSNLLALRHAVPRRAHLRPFTCTHAAGSLQRSLLAIANRDSPSAKKTRALYFDLVHPVSNIQLSFECVQSIKWKRSVKKTKKSVLEELFGLW